MKQEEFVKGLTYLGLAYGKEYNQMETKQIYEFLKEYNYETFTKAINSIIRSSKFVPKIADLIEACEENKSSQRIEVVKYMKDIGYFKYSPYGEITDEHASRNFQKALMFLERNNVPDWLQDDINYFYNKMKQERLTATTNNLLN